MILNTSTRNDLGSRGYALRGITYDDGNRRNLGDAAVVSDPIDPLTGNLYSDESAIQQTQMPILTPPIIANTTQPTTSPIILVSDPSGLQTLLTAAQGASGALPAGSVLLPAATPAASWFTQQTIFAGLPNWLILAGGGAIAMMFAGGDSAPARRRR